MAFDHAKFLLRFVEEAREHCSRISDGLLSLEHAPQDGELINALFRSAHTIKGSSRMMKLLGVTELAHRMEDLLDAVRGGRRSLDKTMADLLFKGVDGLQGMLDQIAAGNQNPDPPEAICEALGQAAAGAEAETPPVTTPVTPPPQPQSAPTAKPEPATPPLPVMATPSASAPTPSPETPPPAPKKGQAEYLRIHAAKLDDLIRLMGEIVSEHGRFRREVRRLHELERSLTRRHTQMMERLHAAESGGHAPLLETGEVLYNQLQEVVQTIQRTSLLQDHLMEDLQGTSLKMRMLPLSTVFDPLRRTVRDLSLEFDKPIEFVVEGGETELDRKIIDRIGDALIHLIRNALDHGLETTAERVATGKPPQGTITVSACYDGGCVTIAISDDGRGILLERIKEKALARRLFDQESLAAMQRSELINLIFMPGFSTSPIITDLSGRGVGMDVVRKSIVDDLKGTIVIDSQEGKGSTFLLRLPLNLAVFPLFLVSVADKTCALPATGVVEMLSLPSAELIEIVNKRAIRLREQLIPVEELGVILGLPHATAAAEVLIVIIRDGEEKLGLLVDDIHGREEMVVKPLPDHLQGLRLVSGVTIGERNSVLNLLHIPELLRRAREIAEPARDREAPASRTATILVVDDSYNTREIEKSILEACGYQVETAGDGEEGFEKSRERLYDLIVTDVEMPRLDGFSLTERLRADDRYHLTPIIIVTSREKDEDKKRGIRVGANAYIVKGAFDQSNLIETVRSLIGY